MLNKPPQGALAAKTTFFSINNYIFMGKNSHKLSTKNASEPFTIAALYKHSLASGWKN